MSTDLSRQQNLGKFSMKELDPMLSPAENMFRVHIMEILYLTIIFWETNYMLSSINIFVITRL